MPPLKSDFAAVLADSALTVTEIARTLGVAPATLYRHIPGGRGSIAPGNGKSRPKAAPDGVRPDGVA